MQSPSLEPPPPLSTEQAKDPDIQEPSHYSKWCGRGSIIIVKPTLGTVSVTPLRCGSWLCPHCGPLKRDELVHRLKRAHANRFLTLTCAHPEGRNQVQAEHAIREGWPHFIAELRLYDPQLQYFRTMEWQANGWPHLHVLLRSKFIPKKFIRTAWNLFCWPGFINIKKIHNHDGIPYELTKYIAKAYLVAQHLGKHQRLYSASRAFFPPKVQQPLSDFDPEALWFITQDTPDQVSTRLRFLPFLLLSPDQPADGCLYRQAWSTWKGWLQELLALCEALPWYNKVNHGQCHPPPF